MYNKNKMMRWALPLAAGAFVSSFYTFGIEPYLLKCRHVCLPTRFEGKKVNLKAVHFTDVHLGPHFNLLHLQKLVKEIMAQKPDIIFFTGDLVDRPRHYCGGEQAGCVLARLDAPYGKFAVLGNHDYRCHNGKLGKRILKQAGFTFLNNQACSIPLPHSAQLRVVGLADALYQVPDYSIIGERQPNQLTVVLTHEGDFADKMAAYHPDIILAGHSHGGQFRLPIIGPVITTRQARIYIRGLYKVSESLVYVDSGLGVSALPGRFLAPPQFSILQIG